MDRYQRDQGPKGAAWFTLPCKRAETIAQVVYVASMALFTIGCAIVAISKSIGLLIGMRCLQAAGSAALPHILQMDSQ